MDNEIFVMKLPKLKVLACLIFWDLVLNTFCLYQCHVIIVSVSMSLEVIDLVLGSY